MIRRSRAHRCRRSHRPPPGPRLLRAGAAASPHPSVPVGDTPRAVELSFGRLRWRSGRNDSATFANRKHLIGLYLRESLDLLSGGPLYFNHVDRLCLAQTEVKTQITL